jgi:CBS domain-containing protein
MLTAEQIMISGVVTIRPEATIRDAIELLLERRISGLPVVDASGALVGMITEYALLALAYDRQVTHETVAQHMTRDIIAADADDPVNSLADQFIVHRVRRLPVTSGGRLVGLVSRVDVLRALYEAEAPVCTA